MPTIRPSETGIDKREPVSEDLVGNWSATRELLNGTDWLTVSPTSSTASLDQPATVSVEFNYAALDTAGLFQVVITVTDKATDF